MNNSPITPADIEGGLVELRETNSGGTPVLFTATIDGTNKIITLTPVQPLAGNTLYYVKMNPVEDASNNPSVTANSTFTTDDTLPPSFTFAPTDASINFSAVGNIIITFNEPIRKLDDTAITPTDIEGATAGTGLVELRENNSGGTAVVFTATINGANTIITLNPNATLKRDQLYYVEMNPVEDAVNNATVADNITFRTEDRPSIGSFVPAAERCIGDPVTIIGSRFTGTGNPVTGGTPPTVYINAVAVPALNITSFNATQIIFTMPSIAAGTFPITVRNNDSDLLSAGSSFDVRPAIDVTFPVTPATLSPAQNTSVDIQIGNTQSPSYSYALILNSGPVGYTATTQTTTGNAGARTLTTTPALNKIGDYVYKIDVSRANCVTKHFPIHLLHLQWLPCR
ncbi:MAG: Ig-like domain-containing protein [Flammeovirgaceae bacterium]|nr:Ig-like domain-containing protein [Flammeovirgaceae bacterium]